MPKRRVSPRQGARRKGMPRSGKLMPFREDFDLDALSAEECAKGFHCVECGEATYTAPSEDIDDPIALALLAHNWRCRRCLDIADQEQSK